MLMGPHHAAIDNHLDLGHLVVGVRPPGDLGMGQDPVERAIGRPPPEPVITALPRAVTLRNLPPRRAGVQMPQDPIEHRAMITPPTPAPRFARRQQRLDLRPRLIGQFLPSDHLPTTDTAPSPTPPKVRTSSPIRQTRPSRRGQQRPLAARAPDPDLRRYAEFRYADVQLTKAGYVRALGLLA
jgi:hypothetical protein